MPGLPVDTRDLPGHASPGPALKSPLLPLPCPSYGHAAGTRSPLATAVEVDTIAVQVQRSIREAGKASIW